MTSSQSGTSKRLFDIDIEWLHEEAIKILEDWKHLDTVQEQAICSYANGQMDLYHEEVEPVSELSEAGDVADLLDEMWQRTSMLVENMDFRRMFVLICRQVIYVKSWAEGEE